MPDKDATNNFLQLELNFESEKSSCSGRCGHCTKSRQQRQQEEAQRLFQEDKKRGLVMDSRTHRVSFYRNN